MLHKVSAREFREGVLRAEDEVRQQKEQEAARYRSPVKEHAQRMLADAFNGQEVSGREELSSAYERVADGLTTPRSALQRTPPGKIPHAGPHFSMRRDWDPSDK